VAGVLSKPTGAICNLACSYCFFLDKETLYDGDRFRMTEDVLERHISQQIEMQRGPTTTLAWQGGEPTLMGVDFFRKAVVIAEENRRPGTTVQFALQTNGTLLTDEWCELLAANDFLVGISIDGPRHLHDAYRVDKRGGGSFDKVMRGLRLLQAHGVEHNVLTTVNRANGSHPLEVYRFLRDEAGAQWMQFIPVVERVDEHGDPADLRGDHASERSVLPEQWGAFLITVFDEWVYRDLGTVSIPTFEAAAANRAGLPASGLCVYDETCGLSVALEHNGDLYSCDHYVDPEYLLGNVATSTIEEMVESRQQRDFGTAKRDTLPEHCLACEVRFACHGECPKNRFLTTPDGEPGLQYLCAGYKAFFRHIDRPIRQIVDLVHSGRPASELVASFEREVRRVGRNGQCPCGSGHKVKRCHGAADRPRPGGGSESAESTEPAPRAGPRPRRAARNT
jgi:uncharacterized protein